MWAILHVSLEGRYAALRNHLPCVQLPPRPVLFVYTSSAPATPLNSPACRDDDWDDDWAEEGVADQDQDDAPPSERASPVPQAAGAQEGAAGEAQAPAPRDAHAQVGLPPPPPLAQLVWSFCTLRRAALP